MIEIFLCSALYFDYDMLQIKEHRAQRIEVFPFPTMMKDQNAHTA